MDKERKDTIVAIAGATGNAGREIVKAAKRAGCRVRALVRDERGLKDAKAHCDEIKIVQVTQADTLKGSLGGVDILISALGKTFQKDKTPRRLVDVDANLHLFAEAKSANIRCVSLVSVFTASLEHPVAMIRMKGEAEHGLKQSGLPYVIIQPSGFFSDMWEIFEGCKRGTFWNVGSKDIRFNPIALSDLADFTIEKSLDPANEGYTFPVGGPDIFTPQEIAKLSEEIIGRPVRIRRIPLWLCKWGVALLRPFNRNLWELGNFFVGNVDYTLTHRGGDGTVPAFGKIHLKDYFRERYTQHSMRF